VRDEVELKCLVAAQPALRGGHAAFDSVSVLRLLPPMTVPDT
jgi:hypothetical protein